MSAPSAGEVKQSADLDRLQEIIQGILGQLCWSVRFSYGDELNVHVGARIPSTRPALAGREKGAWILGTRGTAWRLESPSGILASSDSDPLQARQRLSAIEGTTIAAFEVNAGNRALTVSFANGCRLLVLPSPEDDAWDLPYWELFTPGHMVLTFGPGVAWSYTRSDQPVRTD
jgi:hypothetical protein